MRRGAAIYPQPVAQTCARVLRARSQESLIDATLKAAEVLTRYAAILGIASWAARQDVDAEPPFKVEEWSGPLAFGVFLSTVEQLAKCAVDHPLRSQLAAGLAPKGKGKSKQPRVAAQALTLLLELRNALGHDLSSLSRAKAVSILRDSDPIAPLLNALGALEGLLDHPLFILEDQQFSGSVLRARRLILMGDASDPEPDEVVLSPGVQCLGTAYLGMRKVALCLSPLLAWDVAPESANYRLYMIDVVDEGQIRHKALDAKPRVLSEANAKNIQAYLAGNPVPAEPVTLKGGKGLSVEWRERRAQIEAQLQKLDDRIPWEDLDAETVSWYARRLGGDVNDDTARAVIIERLLDGREHLTARDKEQLVVLFGSDQAARELIGRSTIDLRAVGDSESRWIERLDESGNVIQSLKAAVGFFGRHVGVEGAGLDGLRETSGTADYIAMREALVNLFIHQDYTDQSAAAQVEVAPERAVFFNPGSALVSEAALLEGGRSQARNPLIARALRLIGFAELAGSGLREVHRAWRDLKRRPPTISSDREGNTFTLALDWRTVPEVYDQYWKGKIGVQLKAHEAKILELAFDTDGVTVQQAASACDLLLPDAEQAIRTLLRQALVDERKGRYHVKPHLRELTQE